MGKKTWAGHYLSNLLFIPFLLACLQRKHLSIDSTLKLEIGISMKNHQDAGVSEIVVSLGWPTSYYVKVMQQRPWPEFYGV